MIGELQCLTDPSLHQVHLWKTTRKLIWNILTQIFQQGRGCFVEGARHGSLNILGNLLATHQFGKELPMEKTNLVSNIPRVDASLCVESNALVYIMELAVKNIVGAQRAAKIGSGDVTVQRVSAEVGNAHALLLDANVTQMFAEIAGLVVEMVH